MIKRIILHWTAGGASVTDQEKDHYNFITDVDGNLVEGEFAPEDQTSANVGRGTDHYAAHTLNCNTASLGHALDAMAGAVEKPFDKGSNPITNKQLEAFVKNTAALALKYQVPITRETILSHAEVEPTLKIKQRQKWDIAWLPGMREPGDPVEVGDKLRALIEEQTVLLMKGKTSVIVTASPVVIRRGSRGEPVIRLQRMLNAVGFAAGRADGIFGGQTENALRAYQQFKQLTIDGVAGPEVWDTLAQEN